MNPRTALASTLGIVVLALTGCGPRKPVLHIYTWADYIDPDVVSAFEKQAGCRVQIDTFDSNEAMYAKLQAGGAGYDVVFPSSYQVSMMRAQGMLQALDPAQLPAVAANIDRDYLRFASDPGLAYSIPYAMTYTGIAYRKDKLGALDASWGVYTNAALAGKCTLLNDMRETIGAGLKYLGHSLNTTNAAELAQARDVVIGWKRVIAKFENEQYKTGIASGEFLLVQGYNCDVLQIQEDSPETDFMLPREGFSFTFDEMVVPTRARQTALAHAFINFMYAPASGARNIAFTCTFLPVKPAYALLDPNLLASPAIFIAPDELEKRGEAIRDVGAALPLYTRTWDEIKAAP
jgi:spermidine/putrescine transport system substrate-binding protein